MKTTVSRSIAALLAGALVVTSLPAVAAQPAPVKPAVAQMGGTSVDAGLTSDFSARKRHVRRGHNNGAAALAAFGLIAGTIATIAANERRNDYYDRYGYGNGYGYYGYAPPPPPRHYYNRGYRYW